MKFTVTVDEVVYKRRLYIVEADSEEEAVSKAEAGDNNYELGIDDGQVVDRFVILCTEIKL